MGAAWGEQDASDCQAEGNSETALKAGRGGGQAPEPWAQESGGARPEAAVLVAPAWPRGRAGTAGTRSPAPAALELADVQHNSLWGGGTAPQQRLEGFL